MKKNRSRDTSLEEFGISNLAYRELIYFCLQYDEKKRKTTQKQLCEYTYQQIAIYRQDIRLIEDTAKEISQNDITLYDNLIKNVCYQIPYEQLDTYCGRRQFYEARKVFFVNLYAKRQKVIEKSIAV